MVDTSCAGVRGSEKNHLAAIFGELFEGLFAESVCDAAAAVVRACGDLADSGEARVCTRSHDAAGAGQCVVVSFEEDDVTVVIGFVAEEDTDGYVGIFKSEYVSPEVEELAGGVFVDGGFVASGSQLSKPPCIPPF